MARTAIILLGPPGAGKGTQGRMLSADFALPSISTGDILREAVRNRTDLGKQAKEHMDRGGLVPDALVDAIVRERLARADCRKGFILDGYPRTVGQARFLDREYSGEGMRFLAIGIAVPDEALVRRLTGRRSCPKCNKIFHIETSPSRKGDYCDECGTLLIQRRDDTVEVVRQRLQVYHESTRPLIEYYRERDGYVEVDGTGPVEAIYRNLRRIVEPYVSEGSPRSA
jgi:adenylate kinase